MPHLFECGTRKYPKIVSKIQMWFNVTRFKIEFLVSGTEMQRCIKGDMRSYRK